MIVDDEKYQVISKGENVYMLSEDGTEQLISEMIYEDDRPISNTIMLQNQMILNHKLAHMDMEKTMAHFIKQINHYVLF